MNTRALRLLPFVPLAALMLLAAVVVPVSIDSGSFMYMGRLLTSGAVPYLDAWDHKGPLMYVLNAGALLLGGDSPRGVLLVEGALTAIALAWTLRVWSLLIGERDAAIVGAALALAYAMFWSSGNLSETWLFPAQLLAYAALLRCALDESPGGGPMRAAGALVGLAAAIGVGTRLNNAMGIVAAAGLFVLWRRTRAVGFVLAAIGTSILVLAPVLLLFRSRGALGEMWDQYWIFNTKFNTTTVPLPARLGNAWFLFLLYVRTPLALVAAASAVLLLRSRARRPLGLLLAGALLVGLEFAAQMISGQGFRHYLVATLPSLATFAVLLRAPVSSRTGGESAVWPHAPVARVAMVAVLAFWGLSTWRALDAMKVRADSGSSVGDAPLAQVAREVQAHAPDGARIYGSGNFGAVLAVAHRPSSSRYFNDYPLLVAGYGPPHVRQLGIELDAKPPTVIVRVPGTCELMEPAPECMPASRTLAAFARGHYTLARTIGDYEVWVRTADLTP